jgi:hypothetical protein
VLDRAHNLSEMGSPRDQGHTGKRISISKSLVRYSLYRAVQMLQQAQRSHDSLWEKTGFADEGWKNNVSPL